MRLHTVGEAVPCRVVETDSRLLQTWSLQPPCEATAMAVARAVASKVMADTCGATQAPLPPSPQDWTPH